MPILLAEEQWISNRQRRLSALVVVLLAFGLRMFRLGYQPLWSDEIYSVAVAQHSLAEVVGWVYRDNHPALYWLILYPVVRLLGDGAFLVRVPSAFMGTLTVVIVYAAGKQILGSRRVGVLAALWLAFSPVHVVYSQEARMYAPLVLFGTTSTLLLHRAVFRGGAVNWLLFGTSAAATAHSHNYGLLLIAAQGLWGFGLLLGTRKYRLLRGSALSLAAFAMLYAPMIPALVIQTQMAVGSTGVPTWHDLLDLLEAFGAGFTGFSTPGFTPGRLLKRISPPSAGTTAALAVLGLILGDRAEAPRRLSSKLASWWSPLLLAVCISFPPAFVYGYSVLRHRALWQVRGFQMAIGSFAVLVGAGLEAWGSRALRWLLCLGLIAVSILNLHGHYFDRYKSTVPDAVAALPEKLTSEDIFFVAPFWHWTPFRYYYHGGADAIGGLERNGTFSLAGVGTDYADLIDSRSLDVQSKVRKPIIAPSQFSPDDYTRVWTISHWATPQRVFEIFGDDVTIMHYDVEAREWLSVLYPESASPPSGAQAFSQSSLLWDNGLRLVGYRWRVSPVVGQQAHLTLLWTTTQPQSSPSYLRLQLNDTDDEVALENHSSLISLLHGIPMVSLGVRRDFPATAWPPGSLVVQRVELDIPPDLPPITYELSLQVASEVDHTVVPLGKGISAVLDRFSIARPSQPYGPREVTVQHRERVSFGGEITLLGYDLPEASPRPGHHLPVWMHWRAEDALAADYEVQVRLLNGKGSPVAQASNSPSRISFPTSMWQAGDLAQGRVDIPLPPSLEAGRYGLSVRLVDKRNGRALPGQRAWSPFSRESIVIGRAEILPWPLTTEAPAMDFEADAHFGDTAELLGYNVAGHPSPGESVSITLYWRAEAPQQKSYRVFVHLADQEGRLVAQADGIPGGWLRPTTTWREGEVISDEHTLDLPSTLPSGSYRPYVGFYTSDGQRLPVVCQGNPAADGRMPLEPLRVAGNE